MAAPSATSLLPPLLVPTTTMSDAVARGSLGVGYAGGGFLLLYYVGVSKMLQQLGIVQVGRTRTAGASIGSFVQAVDHGFPHEAVVDGVQVVSRRCRQRHNCLGSLGEVFTGAIEDAMRSAVNFTAQDGSMCSMLTRVQGKDGTPQPGYTCEFKGKLDWLQGVHASTYVPGWSGAAAGVPFRGEIAYDGAYAQILPCPPNVTYCIKVAAFPPWDGEEMAAVLSTPARAKVDFSAVAAGLRDMVGDPVEFARLAAQRGVLDLLDVRGWLPMFQKSQKPIADIYPGRFKKPRLSPFRMLMYVVTPPDKQTNRDLYEMGMEDALAWAKSVGWPAADRGALRD